MATQRVILACVGDVMVNRSDPKSSFEFSRAILKDADIAFCQLETAYSHLGSMGSSGPRGAMPHDPRNYEAIPWAGFDVISMASNHIMDWGRDALLDCIAHLGADGIDTIGAGENISAAREPAIIERNGIRVGFLGYCSVAPQGYYASGGRAGVAPMRAMTYYHAVEEDQPGTPCEIITIPYPEDLNALLNDIRELRPKVDVLVVSLHWGIHYLRAELADYQRIVARAAIDAGTDLIVGHHPHMLKGIEVYKGKVVFYSLGNFAFDMGLRSVNPQAREEIWGQRRERVFRKFHAQTPSPDSPTAMASEAKYTIIAKILLEEKKIKRVSFIPALINTERQSQPLTPETPAGQEVVNYVKAITDEAGLSASYTIGSDDVVICSGTHS